MSFVRKNSNVSFQLFPANSSSIHVISSESATTLQHLKSEQERIIHRISSLQNLLIDNTTSIVKRSKAKVELTQLQKKYTNYQTSSSLTSRRASLQNLGCRHVVGTYDDSESTREEDYGDEYETPVSKRMRGGSITTLVPTTKGGDGDDAGGIAVPTKGEKDYVVEGGIIVPTTKGGELDTSNERNGSGNYDLRSAVQLRSQLVPSKGGELDTSESSNRISLTDSMTSHSSRSLCMSISKGDEEGDKEDNEEHDASFNQLLIDGEEGGYGVREGEEGHPPEVAQDVESLVQQQRRGSRRLSFQASIDPAFSAQLKRASHSSSGDLNKQMREEAKINMAALEERLKDIARERSELLNELDTMKALLAAADGEKKSGKVTERLVYQLSCKKCNKLSCCVGKTDDDLKTTMKRHVNEVYEYMQSGKKNKSDDSNKNKSDGGGSPKSSDSNTCRGTTGCWNAQFAAHFAKHCKPAIKFKSVSKKEVIRFCRQYVKVEVLKRSDGAELYWEDHE